MCRFGLIVAVVAAAFSASCAKPVTEEQSKGDSSTPTEVSANAEAPEAVAVSSTPQVPDGFLRVSGQKFVDPEGRQIILHGMSVISKSPEENYQSWHGPGDIAQMRRWGMNCIRLGILWDGVEPEPGKYDEEYLKKVDQRIAWAKENDIYVFLDMHQDLFSRLYSDGAPEWATLTDGQPHVNEGGVWSDAYFTSPAVQTAFENFWANKPASDGVGVQDHFAQMWRHVAERYADEPTVLGYDLFNEPNAGSMNIAAQLKMIEAFANAVAEKDGTAPAVAELVAQWLDPAGRSQAMKRLEDMDIYRAVLAAADPMFQEFERTQLMPMFQRVTDAIREVDPHHIILLETSMSANMGMYSGIEPVTGPDGKRDPQQAYAPHGYDIVVDTPDLANASTARIELIFERHGETADRLDMPMIIGEWGAYGGANNVLPTARAVVRQFEKLLCGDTYWEYGRYVQDAAYLEVLDRPYPQRIAGTLMAYHANPESKEFTCEWREDGNVSAPSRIYLPERYGSDPQVELSPEGGDYTVEPAAEGAQSVCLVIPPIGDNAARKILVRPSADAS